MATEQEILAKWQIYAYPHYKRGPFWYVIASILGIGLVAVAFYTYNFLLAALVVMVGVVLMIMGAGEPPMIDVEIGTLGIRRGTRFFPYKSIGNFWIVYDPPIKSLHLVVPRSLFTTVHIPIDDQDPLELRAALKRYVREDMERDSEPIIDTVARILKI
jgi:hypothetical protein